MWRPYSPIVSDLPCHWVLSMFVGDVGRRDATSSHVKNLTAQTWRSTRGWSFSSKCGFWPPRTPRSSRCRLQDYRCVRVCVHVHVRVCMCVYVFIVLKLYCIASFFAWIIVFILMWSFSRSFSCLTFSSPAILVLYFPAWICCLWSHMVLHLLVLHFQSTCAV